MAASRVQIDETTKTASHSVEMEGCLLLSYEGNVIFSLNGSALVVWEEMERHPEGINIENLVDYLEIYYSDYDVSREQLGRDAAALLSTLSERGFLSILGDDEASAKYRIKDDVFRNEPDRSTSEQFDSEVDEALAYRPTEPPSSGRIRALADIWRGFVAILLYEAVLKFRGFARLCAMVERWPVKKTGGWEALRVRQVCASVDRARAWYPKKVLCLQHSAVVTCLLRRQGVPARMVIAARRKPFYAHAYVEVNDTVVNDEQKVGSLYNTFFRCLGTSQIGN